MSFHLSKLIQTFIEPANALALLLLLAALLLVSPWEGARERARKFVLFLAVLFVLIAVLPVGEWALAPLENRFAQVKTPESIDGIIVLTGDESPLRSDQRGQPVTGDYAASRYVRLAAMARLYPKAKIIISGDTAPYYKSKTTTQTIAKQVAEATGIDPARLVFEKESLTTFDNARLTAKLLKPQKNEEWLLITSAWHMPRSVLCFERQNMKVVPVQAGYETNDPIAFGFHLNLSQQLLLLRIAAHEYYGLVGYWVSGRTARLWP